MTAFVSMGGTFTWPLLIMHRGHASLMAGELDEAQTFAERALALTRDRDRSIIYAADRANGGLYVLEYLGKKPLN